LTHERITLPVLSVPIDVISWDAAVQRIMSWAARRMSRYVTICNAHVVVTASRSSDYYKVIAQSDMATPDGAPVAWMIRRLGFPEQPKISGPDLMPRLLEQAASHGISVFFLGSTTDTLALLEARIREAHPDLVVGGMYSPPFRPLLVDEDAAVVAQINESGAGLIFVGLGCPKQERWMAEHRGRVNGVMLGVGAAFDFYAGSVKRAPEWMQRFGLEWLHRLISEPRRLWKRYLTTNTLFVLGAAKQLLAERR
jgi:N-acetylglucosaminyldiphosphoundecaprenol N-acetyl-beta-D-mannosaminyltransferase